MKSKGNEYNNKNKNMEKVFDVIKAIWITFVGYVSSIVFYFAPIHGLFVALSVAFSLSFLFGVIAGLRAQDEILSKDKAFRAVTELCIYFVMISALFVIGDKMDGSVWIYEVLSVINWALIYFYIANTFKNLKRLFPKSKGIAFLFCILNLEFVKRFPQFKDFEDENK